MALIINTNLGSINGQRNLNGSAISQATSMQRLSSGVRVNSAKDDAAGLAIADRMHSQIRGMTVAVRNANDGISLTQSAEGALGSLTDTLQRMRDLAVQSSSNAGVSSSDREKLQTEFNALNDELIRVVQNSEFNGKKILNGDLASGLSIQVGATTDTNSRINIAVSNMSTLLAPVTNTTLFPRGEPIDATLSSTIANAASVLTSDATLKMANEAAKLANAALEAAKLAVALPTDLALARAAANANSKAAKAIAESSNKIFAMTAANKTAELVPDAFAIKVNAANRSNLAAQTSIGYSAADTVGVMDALGVSATINQTVLANGSVTNASGSNLLVMTGGTTDTAQAASLLTTATQLAAAAAADVDFAGQNAYAVTMNKLTGDTLSVIDSRMLAIPVDNALNASVLRYAKGAFGSDREAQKKLAALSIAKSIAAASYVNDPTITQTANDTNKLSFINNNRLVIDTSMAADSVATDYALSSINAIDEAIALIDTERSNLGSTQNRFTTTISNLQNGIENQSAAKSRIMDADFAQETAALSRSQILQQAGTAMLAQANQTGQTVMALLRQS